MDEQSDANNSHNSQLNAQQTEQLLQFQDLTGIEDIERCKQILVSHNWNLESAVSVTFDDRVDNANADNIANSQLRHRNRFAPPDIVNQLDNNHNDDNNNNNNNNNNNTTLSIWSFTTRIISLPFTTITFIYDTLLSIIRFALHIIRADHTRSVETAATDITRFVNEFESQFGSRHPVFSLQPYGQALNEAKRELRFLLLYLHSDAHQHTKQFCQTVITNDAFINFIAERNILFWACSVKYAEGYRVTQALHESGYPFLALIVSKDHRMVVIKRFEGLQTLEPLLTDLRKNIEENEAIIVAARAEREERTMNQRLRQQQDEAFAESLRADQEKERRKQEEKNKKEAEERIKKEIEFEESKRKERMLRLKEELVHKIPEEPHVSDANATKIVIKLPNGTRLERRFLKTQPIKYLYYFVFCQPQSPFYFQIRTNFPTRDLPGKPPTPEQFDNCHHNSVNCDSHDDSSPTFEECDLGKGAMLFVHDLEA